jgi:transcriptional regulator with XRE-family HTH domain
MTPATTLAQRLARAIAVMHPAVRGPYTSKEIAEGTGLSVAYVNLLLAGRRGRRVSQETLSKLSAFLGVPVGYLADDEDSARVEEQLESLQLLAALKRAEVKNIATRLGDLSEADLRLFAEFLDRLHPNTDQSGQQGRSGRQTG